MFKLYGKVRRLHPARRKELNPEQLHSNIVKLLWMYYSILNGRAGHQRYINVQASLKRCPSYRLSFYLECVMSPLQGWLANLNGPR